MDAHLENVALGPCGFRQCKGLERRNNVDVKSGRAAIGKEDVSRARSEPALEFLLRGPEQQTEQR